MDQLLDVGQAQKLLGVSRPTVFRLVRSGEIAVVKIGSRTLFRADDLRHFVDQHVRRAPRSAFTRPCPTEPQPRWEEVVSVGAAEPH